MLAINISERVDQLVSELTDLCEASEFDGFQYLDYDDIQRGMRRLLDLNPAYIDDAPLWDAVREQYPSFAQAYEAVKRG